MKKSLSLITWNCFMDKHKGVVFFLPDSNALYIFQEYNSLVN